MNTKDVPAMYSTAFWYLFVVLLVFLALLGVTTVTPLIERQTDTKMQWNTLQVSLLYSFHLRKSKFRRSQ